MKIIAESPKPITSAYMLDSGNFVIYNKTDVIWECFDYPTDTLLVGQRLISGHNLVSSVSEIDHSIERFYLSMQADGNLVAYPTNYIYLRLPTGLSCYKVEANSVSIVEQDCRKSCLEDCTCWATQYVNGVYSKFKLPLIYSTLDPTDQSVKAFVKQSYNISQIAGHTLPYPEKAGNRNKSRKEIILILSLTLGFVAFLRMVVAICSYHFYRSSEGQYQKLLENPYLGPNEEFTLRSFSYSELEKATEHFKEEIRHGSFGNLYKGILSEGNRTIAVKRLEKLGDEAEREFKAEMTAIGQARYRDPLSRESGLSAL
ncbi:G-type lectin S-receptor-like serine/threonine-protein kinase RLK1 [Nicotiana tomentosiformis]|uniref:G-type lectin S-receptor-like serine/threonine-protein kinase RLK1 n=1 Tax=Nicotiana tomentosiformis TaxID=4098 RepID=UPI00388C5ABD